MVTLPVCGKPMKFMGEATMAPSFSVAPLKKLVTWTCSLPIPSPMKRKMYLGAAAAVSAASSAMAVVAAAASAPAAALAPAALRKLRREMLLAFSMKGMSSLVVCSRPIREPRGTPTILIAARARFGQGAAKPG